MYINFYIKNVCNYGEVQCELNFEFCFKEKYCSDGFFFVIEIVLLEVMV